MKKSTSIVALIFIVSGVIYGIVRKTDLSKIPANEVNNEVADNHSMTSGEKLIEEANAPAVKNNLLSDPSDIDIEQLLVSGPGGSIVKLNYTKQQLTDAFGAPVEIQTEYFEMDNKNADVYIYNGGKFYFVDGLLDSFEITGTNFKVQTNPSKKFFTVGQNFSNLEEAGNLYKHTLSLWISKNGVQTETFLYIEFNLSDSIYRISLWST